MIGGPPLAEALGRLLPAYALIGRRFRRAAWISPEAAQVGPARPVRTDGQPPVAGEADGASLAFGFGFGRSGRYRLRVDPGDLVARQLHPLCDVRVHPE